MCGVSMQRWLCIVLTLLALCVAVTLAFIAHTNRKR